MLLVDYASSSDDEEDTDVRRDDVEDEPQVPKHDLTPNPPPQNQRSGLLSNERLESASSSSTPSVEKLPDASLLLNSPAFPFHIVSGSDHSSLVAAAMAESASRKREANGLSSSFPHSKVPRGTLTHTKNIPETVGALLVPPQVSGREQEQGRGGELSDPRWFKGLEVAEASNHFIWRQFVYNITENEMSFGCNI